MLSKYIKQLKKIWINNFLEHQKNQKIHFQNVKDLKIYLIYIDIFKVNKN